MYVNANDYKLGDRLYAVSDRLGAPCDHYLATVVKDPIAGNRWFACGGVECAGPCNIVLADEVVVEARA